MTKLRRVTAPPDQMLATCEILRSIAGSYPARSRERKAIREAAEAFVFLTMHEQLKASYDQFRRLARKGLTKAQKRTLRRMGIKP
jgi:hypothetical protein